MTEITIERPAGGAFIQDVAAELESVPCPLCGGRRNSALLAAHDCLYGSPGEYSLVQCEDCSLKYVNPRPTWGALARHYPEDYFASRSPEDSPFFLRFVQKVQAVGRLNQIERLVGRLGGNIRLLDVGCGANELVRQFQKLRGGEGVGVEFNPRVVENVRKRPGAPIVQGTLRDAAFSNAQFDVVTMMQYLEHEPDPRGVLMEARRVLRKGGHLVIEVPYPDGLPARLFGSNWATWDFPRHLVFFNQKTLERMLAECGLRMVRAQTFGVPFAIGISFATALGCRHLNRFGTLELALLCALSLPFVPFTPLLPEFMSVLAVAE